MEEYYGQEINSASSGKLGTGALDDPEWNGRADPWFSPDGTKIVYWQAKTVSPACGGENPLPCFDSIEPGGRTERLLIAHLTARSPIEPAPVKEQPDTIPWAVPYVAGKPSPARVYPREGDYILQGLAHGFANVRLTEDESKARLETVQVEYHNFSDDGIGQFWGSQKAKESVQDITIDHLDWSSNVSFEGLSDASQITCPGGFHLTIDVMQNVFQANGSLVTTIDGKNYTQPADGQ